MSVEELVSVFEQLPAADQAEVFKRVMPILCELFKRDPQRMTAEMMPLCREMMQGCGIEPQAMMSMMAKKNKERQ